jgi:hypothetical protein
VWKKVSHASKQRREYQMLAKREDMILDELVSIVGKENATTAKHIRCVKKGGENWQSQILEAIRKNTYAV